MSMSDPTNGGNGHTRVPTEVIELHFPQLVEAPPPPPRKRPLWPALLLFLLTVISTLDVGWEFSRSYAEDRQPFSGDDSYAALLTPLKQPRLLLTGIPFSFTLMGILLAHELGHYYACKFYRIDASYPYFIPAPTLIGTFGAFIRIRSPITTRRALFDVGLAGPVVGFLVALPAMAFAVATAKVVPDAPAGGYPLIGNPPLVWLFAAMFHPGIRPAWLLLHPIGRAAGVALFATALNLLPAWQLDGGHILYSLASANHRRVSLGVALALISLGIYASYVWAFWGFLLLILTLRFRHPPLIDPWQPLDSIRRLWAVVAVAIFLLCFTPWQIANP